MESQWHAKQYLQVLKELNSGEYGLSAQDARERLAVYGPNALPEAKIPGIFSIFFSQFFSPLIYILLAAAIIIFFMGETADAVIICFILVFNAVVGTIQEGRAQHTLRALRRFVETSASVLRDNKIIVIADKDIVPGDIIILQEGDKIPADARLIFANNLKINEASLTGESAPALKTASTLPDRLTPTYDQKNMVFKGTSIVSGNGSAIAVSTGLKTEIGKISKAIAAIDTEVPLKKNIRFLSRVIIIAVFSIDIALLIFGIVSGQSLRDMFATVVSLSVSIIPEGLPIVMTLVLATGVWRMTKRNVLVKKLQAVEALGQAKIIAVDKTGTLTKNEMVLEKVYINGKYFDVVGQGYEPTGGVFLDGKAIDPMTDKDLVLAGRVASYSTNAHAMYLDDTKTWKISGDPTEAALGVFAVKIGIKDGSTGLKRMFELPFDYRAKYQATIHEFERKNFLALVGAPEKIIELSQNVLSQKKSEKLSLKKRQELEKVFLDMSQKGLRVLAFAINKNVADIISVENLPPLTFCGFFAMKDPLREEAIAAIAKVRQAGIRVVMITGDHKVTAAAIAREAGLSTPQSIVITGEDLDSFSDDELIEKFANCNIFARVTPEHKLRIIQIFKKRAEVVAMTGDGVNDAPSLAAADLGVAMGKIGTEVAKEAADLVLLDDNFGNITAAVEEGRSIYKTIKKVILYLFSTNIGEVLAISGAIFLGLPLPVTPIQIIWLNFVTDGFLDISLAMEPKEEGLLNNQFARPRKYILDSFTIKRMLYMGVVIMLGTLFMFAIYLDNGIEKALTMSLATLAAFQWFNAWNCKSENRSVFTLNPFKNIFLVASTITVIVLQLLAIYHPLLQRYLHTTPLTFWEWSCVIAVAATILLFEEIRKLFSRRLEKNISYDMSNIAAG